MSQRIAKTPDLLQGGIAGGGSQDSERTKHVSFDTHSLVRSNTVSGGLEAESPSTVQPNVQLSNLEASKHSDRNKSHERLIMGLQNVVSIAERSNSSATILSGVSSCSYANCSLNSSNIGPNVQPMMIPQVPLNFSSSYVPSFRVIRRAHMKTQATQTEQAAKAAAAAALLASQARDQSEAFLNGSIPDYLTLSPRASAAAAHRNREQSRRHSANYHYNRHPYHPPQVPFRRENVFERDAASLDLLNNTERSRQQQNAPTDFERTAASKVLRTVQRAQNTSIDSDDEDDDLMFEKLEESKQLRKSATQNQGNKNININTGVSQPGAPVSNLPIAKELELHRARVRQRIKHHSSSHAANQAASSTSKNVTSRPRSAPRASSKESLKKRSPSSSKSAVTELGSSFDLEEEEAYKQTSTHRPSKSQSADALEELEASLLDICDQKYDDLMPEFRRHSIGEGLCLEADVDVSEPGIDLGHLEMRKEEENLNQENEKMEDNERPPSSTSSSSRAVYSGLTTDCDQQSTMGAASEIEELDASNLESSLQASHEDSPTLVSDLSSNQALVTAIASTSIVQTSKLSATVDYKMEKAFAEAKRAAALAASASASRRPVLLVEAKEEEEENVLGNVPKSAQETPPLCVDLPSPLSEEEQEKPISSSTSSTSSCPKEEEEELDCREEEEEDNKESGSSLYVTATDHTPKGSGKTCSSTFETASPATASLFSSPSSSVKRKSSSSGPDGDGALSPEFLSDGKVSKDL